MRIFLEENHESQPIPPEVRYASLFWTVHCSKAGISAAALMPAAGFAEKHGKIWITILCFLEEPEEGRISAIAFEDMVDVSLLEPQQEKKLFETNHGPGNQNRLGPKLREAAIAPSGGYFTMRV